MTTALLSGQIDAAATWSPNTVTIEEQLGDNYLVLGTNTDYSDEVAFPSSFVCLPDYAEENAEVLARFGAAIDKAQQYRAENIEEVAKLLSSELDVPEETMVAATGEGDWQGAVDCQGDTDTILGYYTAQQQGLPRQRHRRGRGPGRGLRQDRHHGGGLHPFAGVGLLAKRRR